MDNQCLCDGTFLCSTCQDKGIKWIGRLSIAALALGMSVANAAGNQVIFTRQVPAPITADQAVLASASGETVYGCQLKEFKISKSGTSVSLRTKKKQLSAEEAEAKIEEIKKQRDQ